MILPGSSSISSWRCTRSLSCKARLLFPSKSRILPSSKCRSSEPVTHLSAVSVTFPQSFYIIIARTLTSRSACSCIGCRQSQASPARSCFPLVVFISVFSSRSVTTFRWDAQDLGDQSLDKILKEKGNLSGTRNSSPLHDVL